MGDSENSTHGPRNLDIVSANLSKSNTLNLCQAILSTLQVVNNKLRSNLGRLTPDQSNALSNNFNLGAVPKLGRHTNDPIYIAKLGETICKRHFTDPNMSSDVKRAWESIGASMDSYAAINSIFSTNFPQKPLFEIILEISKALRAGGMYIYRKMELTKAIVNEFGTYLNVHEELNSVPQKLTLGQMDRQTGLDIASKASTQLLGLLEAVKNLMKAYPAGEEIIGAEMLIGNEALTLDFLKIMDLHFTHNLDLGLFCSKVPISRNSDKHIKEFFESDSKTLGTINQLTAKDHEAKTRVESERNAFIQNLKGVLEDLEAFTLDSSLSSVKACKERLDNVTKHFGSLQIIDNNIETITVDIKTKDGSIRTIQDVGSEINVYKVKIIEIVDQIDKKNKG